MISIKNRFLFALSFLVVAFSFLFHSSSAIAQTQPLQTLTTINGWNAYVHLPDDYATTGTKTYPLILFFPGVGEVGTNASLLLNNGSPSYWVSQGNPMQFMVNGVLEKPIVISVQPAQAWPQNTQTDAVISTILAQYRVDPNRVYLTGLSMGGWEADQYVIGGPQYADRPAAIVPMSAVEVDPFSSYANYATAGGKSWWIEGADDIRNMAPMAAAMNGAVPNSAQYTLIPSGDPGSTHCCWSTFYDPVNWATNPDNNYKESVYTWMLSQNRSGKPTYASPTASAGAPQSISLPTSSVTLTSSATANAPGATITGTFWSQNSGPIAATVTAPWNGSTTITGMTTAGTYVFQIVVTDSNGATATGLVTITVNAPGTTSPIVNAGTSQTLTSPTSSATLSGSVTDSNPISSYKWTQTSGPVTATIASSTAASTSVTGLTTAGSYVFQLAATDSKGLTGTGTVTITISTPSNGTTTTFVDIGNTGTTTTPGWNNLINPSTGTSLSLISSTGASTGATLQVTQPFYTNTAYPIGSGTSNGTTTSTLYPATATEDALYISQWSSPSSSLAQLQLSGLNSSSLYTLHFYASVVAGDGQNRTATYSVGSNSVSLNATDNVNNSVMLQNIAPTNGTITINITQASGSPYAYLGVLEIDQNSNGGTVTKTAPTVSAGSAQSITLPTSSVTLAGSAAVTTTGATIASYKWTQTSGPVTATIASSTAASTSVTGLTTAGSYVFQLAATDSNALSGTATVTITVAAAKTAPTVSAGSAQSITLPTSSVTLAGSAAVTTTGATIASYKWTQTSGPVTATIASSTAASTSVTGLTTAGSYVFQLAATDSNALSGTATVTITVAAAKTAPTVSAGSAQSITLPTSSVTLAGSAAVTTTGATIASYKWTQTSGPVTATIASSTAASTSVTGLTTAGSYVFQLAATDSNALSGTATVTITVAAAKTAPTVSAGSAQSITLPTSSVTLAGSAAVTTTGATIASYKWTQTSGPVTATIASSTAASTSVTGLTTAGSYVFQLAATDSNALSGTATVTITVAAAKTAPTVSAGSAQSITLPTSSVTLAGSAAVTTTGATIASYKWTQTSGPVTATIASSTAASTSVTGLTTAGSYVFQLAATDSNALSGTATVTITVAAAKTAPTVSAGSAQSITLPTSSVTLAGSAAVTTTGATIASYKWTQTSGPVTATIASSTAASTSVTGLTTAGSYVFQLAATDSNALSGTATVTITVAAAKTAPTVSAGSAQSITLPTSSVTLAGSAAVTTTGATIASYKWTQTSGPVTATIASSTAASTSVTGLTTAGSYVFQLAATDSNALSGTATVTITVAAAKTAPTVSAGSAQSITLPTSSVTLAGSAAVTTTGATIASYKWTQTSGPVTATIASSTAASTSVTGLTTAGSYVFQLAATDSNALSGTATVTITVAAAKTAPTVSAGSAQSITLPTSSVTLAGSAAVTTTGATIASYKWTQTSGPVTATIASSTAASTSVTGLTTAGSYVFQLAATDSNALSGTATVTITVAAAKTAPTVSAGSAQSITLPTSSVTLAGSAAVTTTGATIASYKWTQTSGPVTATIASSTAASTSVTGLTTAGSYVFQLAATDSNALSGTATVTITVAAAKTAPTVSAGSAQSITLPTSSVTLAGSAAVTTTGATIASYKWTQTSGPVTATIASSTAASTSVTGLTTAGSYVFQLAATDSNALSGTATVTITVAAAKTAPTVSAGSAQSITLPTSSVTLAGSAAVTTTGATIASYKWTQTSGPVTATIASSTAASTSVTGLTTAGSYVFQLAATDSNALSGTATVTITVAAAKTAPTVSAGSAQSITLPTSSVTLAGSAAVTTTGATIASYKWTQTSGPVTATIASSTAASTSVTGLTTAGSYVFQLAATDSNALSGTATVTITVAAAKTAPTVSAGSAQSITLPTSSVTLAGSAAVTTTGATIASYKWTQTSGPVTATIASSTAASTSVTGLTTAGSYVFQLAATDSNALSGTATVTITVAAAIVTPPSTPSARTMLIDIGNSPTNTTTPGWNNMFTPTVGTTVPLVDTTGASTGATLQVTQPFYTNTAYPIGSGTSNGTTTSTLYPATATEDALYISQWSSPSSSLAQLQLSGLNSSSLYTLHFYASVVAGDGQNRTATYSVGSNSVSLNATDNVNNSVMLQNIAPTNGTITINITQASGSPYAYLGVLEVDQQGSGTTTTPPAAGLNYKYYQGSWTQLPTWSSMTPVNSGSVTNLDLTPATQTTNFGFVYDGFITAPTTGTYTFYISSDDGSRLLLNGTTLINNDNTHSAVEKSATISLTANTPVPVEVQYFQATGKDVLTWSWQGPGFAKQAIPVSVLTIGASITPLLSASPAPTSAAPTVSAGSAQSITLPTSSVTLAGSATDSGGTIASYKWTQVSGPATGLISSSISTSTSVTGLTVAGTYVFQFAATDNNGLTGTATVTITVAAATVSASAKTMVVDLGNAGTSTTTTGWNNLTNPSLGTSVSLVDSTGASTGASLQVTQPFHTDPGYIVGSGDANGTSASTLYPATATDDSFYISQWNTPPATSAQLQLTGLNSSSLYTLHFYASVMAGDGVNRTTVYTVGSNSVVLNATDNVNNSVMLQNIAPTNGTITINLAQQTGSSYAYLGVLEIDQQSGPIAFQPAPPIVNPGPSQTIPLPITLATFIGSAIDTNPNGTISSYKWTQVSGPATATIVSPTATSTTATGMTVAGTYVFQLAATDNDGATGTSTVTVVISPTPTVAYADPTTANSAASVVPYTGAYGYGMNTGYFGAQLTNQNVAQLAANAGSHTLRTSLPDWVITGYGTTASLPDFQYYNQIGMLDLTAFIGGPNNPSVDGTGNANDTDPTIFPGDTVPAQTFGGLYQPVWLDAAKTKINPANTLANYLYKTVTTYGQYVKFWEIWNEPDFTYSGNGDAASGTPGNWWDNNPAPSDLTNLQAPIFYYVRTLRVAWDVIKTLQPNAYVATGGIGYPSFLDAVLRNTDNPVDGSVTAQYPLKGGAYFDVLSYHSYPFYYLGHWDNTASAIVYNRNSDTEVDNVLARKADFTNVLTKYGYNGTTYPLKQWILTETDVPRETVGTDWGSTDDANNFIIKTHVEAQANGIAQVDKFSLGEQPALNTFNRMGVYGDLTPSTTTVANAPKNPQFTAVKTVSQLLYGKTYNAAQTALLNLPTNVRGGAFKDANGNYTYVLWARTTTDNTEAASATYTFPFAFSGTRMEYDFSSTNASTTASQTVALTGFPSFFVTTGGTTTTQTAQTSVATPANRVSVNATTLNVRSAANTTASILGTEVSGALGTVLSSTTGWDYVQFDNGLTGYASTTYLTATTS